MANNEAELRPWELLQTSCLMEAKPWLEVYQDQVRLPSGRVLDDFYRVVLTDFAIVAALTPQRELVMVRSYKHGLGRVSLIAPAGYVEPGESPLEAARRELLEETGYQASDWRCLGRFLLDGNRHCGYAHVFLARQAVHVGVGQKEDDAEEIQVELMNPGRFFQAIEQGDIALLPTASTLALALLAGLDGDESPP